MFTLLEELDPDYYRNFIYTDKRVRKCMYPEANKAVYGTLETSLLFWGKLSKILEEMVYHRNEYYWFIMNKIIDDNQCTILWYVNALKTLHIDLAIIPRVLADVDA